MTDHTTDFFDRLGSQPQPLLNQVTATMRIDLDERNATRHWYLDIDKGRDGVSERNAEADVVVHTNHSLFERVVTGQANAMAATLRGQLTIDGDRQLLVAFQRLMPGPPRAVTANLPTKGSAR
jgi:putative sterol carrier protein